MHQRTGFTIMEIMLAVTMASFMAAIGFTGISAFGKSITRSKQFASESEMIISCMRMAIKEADGGGPVSGKDWIIDPAIPSPIITDPNTLYTMPVPRNWAKCMIDDSNSSKIIFELADTLKVENAGGSDTGSNVRGGLNMAKIIPAGPFVNTLTIKTLIGNRP